MSDLSMTTPRGHAVVMEVRDGTADHNNVWSCIQEDEYGLRYVHLGAVWTVDMGAHIGGVAIALALDNPDARVIAVEPVPDNVDLLRRNIERNKVWDRVSVVHAAAGKPGQKTATVSWNFGGGESAEHHRYIGNAHNIAHTTSDTAKVDAIDLDGLALLAGGPIVFVKVDCEGGEYDLFQGDAAAVVEIRGEYHAGFTRLEALLSATHDVEMTRGTEDFGGFRAVRRLS